MKARPDKFVHVNADLILDDLARTGRPEYQVAKEAKIANGYFSLLRSRKGPQARMRWSYLKRITGSLRTTPNRYLANGDAPKKATVSETAKAAWQATSPLFSKKAPTPSSPWSGTKAVISGYLALSPEDRSTVDSFLTKAKEIGL